jgi:hypothetical protein
MTALEHLLRQSLKIACIIAGLTTMASTGHAQSGPFAGLDGAWSGSGTILVGDNGSERIRCRANYTVASAGTTLQQSLRCASDSYRFDLSSNVVANGSALTGTWSEATRNVSGDIQGRAGRGQFNAVVSAVGFSASLNMVARGNKQTISITSQNTDLRGVQIVLAR